MRISKSIILLLAALSGLTSAARAGSVWNENPVHTEPGKQWWDTDPQQYHELMVLEQAKPDLIIAHGEMRNGTTVPVALGDVVEVRFAEYHEGTKYWRFDGKSGPPIDRLYIDWFGRFENGVFQMDKPGVKLYRFRAQHAGLLTLRLTCADTYVPDPATITTPECTTGTVNLSFDIH
jgi:hypothetical protein